MARLLRWSVDLIFYEDEKETARDNINLLCSIIEFVIAEHESIDLHIWKSLERIYKSLLRFMALRLNDQEFRKAFRKALDSEPSSPYSDLEPRRKELDEIGFVEPTFEYTDRVLEIIGRTWGKSTAYPLNYPSKAKRLFEEPAMDFVRHALRELVPIISECFQMSRCVRGDHPFLDNDSCELARIQREFLECEAQLPFTHWEPRIGELLANLAELLERAADSGNPDFFADHPAAVVREVRDEAPLLVMRPGGRVILPEVALLDMEALTGLPPPALPWS